MRATELAEDAPDAGDPRSCGRITGVVWSFTPGGGTAGRGREQAAIGGATVELRNADGGKVASSKTEDDGTFRFEDVEDGQYRVAVAASTFAAPFRNGWLGEA